MFSRPPPGAREEGVAGADAGPIGVDGAGAGGGGDEAGRREEGVVQGGGDSFGGWSGAHTTSKACE